MLPKEIVFSKKTDAWQNNFYVNADRECLMDYLCSRFFEENDYDEAVFDYFCSQCFCFALKAVSYLLYKFFRRKMQLKVFCYSCVFDVMLKVKHFFHDLIRKAVEGDMTSCFNLCSFRSQCNVEMERQIFIKFGHDDVVSICYKCFAIRISFLDEYLINRLRDCYYKFEKVSNGSCIQLLKNIISTIKIFVTAA